MSRHLKTVETCFQPKLIAGYVDTSHGRVVTTVRQDLSFSNEQEFVVANAVQGAQGSPHQSEVSNTMTGTDTLLFSPAGLTGPALHMWRPGFIR